MTAAVGNLLVVNVKTPINSVKELIALAKQKPAELTFASSGLGGAPHLIGEFFALTTGVKLTHIAYKGGGPAITDLLGGNVSIELRVYDFIAAIHQVGPAASARSFVQRSFRPTAGCADDGRSRRAEYRRA